LTGDAIRFLVANATGNDTLGVVVGFAVGKTLEAVVAVVLLRRSIGAVISFGRLRDVLAFVTLAAFGSTTISATIGVTSLCLGEVQPWSSFASLWWVWWLGDSSGALLVTPLLLTWSEQILWERGRRARHSQPEPSRARELSPLRWRGRRAAEAVLLVGMMSVLALAVFGGSLDASP